MIKKLTSFLAVLTVFFLSSLLVACSQDANPASPTATLFNLDTVVAATLTAFVPPATATPVPEQINTPASTAAPQVNTPTDTAAPQEPTATLTPTDTTVPLPSPTAPTASISGKVCYRSRDIPAMTAYFEDKNAKVLVELPVSVNQTTYTVQLQPGSYIAYAWLTDFSLGGLYSQAVPCGMKSSCKDHNPVPLTVKAGDVIKDVDLCDWYAFAVPEPPNKPVSQVRGEIIGKVLYPTKPFPALHVVALNQTSGYWYYVVPNSSSGAYTIPDLPPGPYQIVAYTENGKAGGYADGSHGLITVTVKAGETTTADINDWSAPAGTFPADPSK
jgi:hypothetical protein